VLGVSFAQPVLWKKLTQTNILIFCNNDFAVEISNMEFRLGIKILPLLYLLEKKGRLVLNAGKNFQIKQPFRNYSNTSSFPSWLSNA